MTYTTEPFGGTSPAIGNPDLDVIKLFGCTVIDFNVSADWSSQGGGLSCRIIEDETAGDRLLIPVLGTPVLFELRTRSGDIVFQYIGLVDSFSRSSSTSKTYSVELTSPLKILEATSVILNGYIGLGSSYEGSYDVTGIIPYDFGHNNSLISVASQAGPYHWWNVSNLINVFGILENDDLLYRTPASADVFGNPLYYGDFGFSATSQDGISLVKLMWSLHMGINHVPPISTNYRQRTHGGNLLFGRHNYNVNRDLEGVPYFYHFDAIGFYLQVKDKVGADYRIGGQYKTLREIISAICDEANLEYFSYIDIYTDPTIGEPTLLETDPNWSSQAVCNWQGMDTRKFPLGGRYGGTIRIQTIDKNAFFNSNRPFSNIAYNLIGLEVPDIQDNIWASSINNSIHPGRRPIEDIRHGIDDDNIPYSEPLDSQGLDTASDGFTKVGTSSIANGGSFPVASSIFDTSKLSDIKIRSSDVSIKLNDLVTMKVLTGGYQTRLVTVPRNLLRHYWGDIIVPNISDPRDTADTETDSLGLNETSTRKIPVVTQLLDPRDIDDFILIDMKSEFGPISVSGVLNSGIYAASMLEVRCAMSSYESWKAFFEGYKYDKLRSIVDTIYPDCNEGIGQNNKTKKDLKRSTERTNSAGGLGYVSISDLLGLGNTFSLHETANESLSQNVNSDGNIKAPPGSGGLFGLGIDIPCAAAEANVKTTILPSIHEKIKEIGDTHYGKSWYAPIPYAKTAEDLDGNNLVGNFKRSWEMTDSAYVEPSLYYQRRIPQSNMFISDGRVSHFVNYDHNFLSLETGEYDISYAQDLTNLMGQSQKICNFSEYSLDQLCMTKYSGVFYNGYEAETSGIEIIHAAPENVDTKYSFLPPGYENIYNRALLPYSDITDGQNKKYDNAKTDNPLAPNTAGQEGTSYRIQQALLQFGNKSPSNSARPFGESDNQVSDEDGYFTYDNNLNLPTRTNIEWFNGIINAESGLLNLAYEDNGRFCIPFVKFSTSRVFMPVPNPGRESLMGDINVADGLNVFLGANIPGATQGDIKPYGRKRQKLMTEDKLISVLKPFQTCVVPKTFNFAQVSTRHVYGPWMTSFNYIAFRGKIEYEQDESLVPENFLVPTNFGQFGDYTFKQVSGFTGMNLAAQARVNSIDNFSLFAVEEGSITIPGGPNIKRIGDSLYGLQQVTDIKINVSNDKIETTYSFKTISPKFGKNNRDLEKKLTKISNDVKKIKLR